MSLVIDVIDKRLLFYYPTSFQMVQLFCNICPKQSLLGKRRGRMALSCLLWRDPLFLKAYIWFLCLICSMDFLICDLLSFLSSTGWQIMCLDWHLLSMELSSCISIVFSLDVFSWVVSSFMMCFGCLEPMSWLLLQSLLKLQSNVSNVLFFHVEVIVW